MFLGLYRHFQSSQWDHAKKHSISSFQGNVSQNHCQTLLHTLLNGWNPKDWQPHLMIDTTHLKLSYTARRNSKSYNHHKKTAYFLIYISKYTLAVWPSIFISRYFPEENGYPCSDKKHGYECFNDLTLKSSCAETIQTASDRWIDEEICGLPM